MNTNVVACAVLSAFGLSAGDSGLYSATTGETHLGNGCSGACAKHRANQAFDSLAPAYSASGLPVCVAGVSAAPLCQTPVSF